MQNWKGLEDSKPLLRYEMKRDHNGMKRGLIESRASRRQDGYQEAVALFLLLEAAMAHFVGWQLEETSDVPVGLGLDNQRPLRFNFLGPATSRCPFQQ